MDIFAEKHPLDFTALSQIRPSRLWRCHTSRIDAQSITAVVVGHNKLDILLATMKRSDLNDHF